ncbi:MAG TPA: hypothetical protein VHM00_17955 [Caldimonas sp.]|jgi:hypothetical protein|nr:hypothetical protein [Caldimonas sp.]HEX2542952.1 hypothetical protein [Caldimonas sp.]
MLKECLRSIDMSRLRQVMLPSDRYLMEVDSAAAAPIMSITSSSALVVLIMLTPMMIIIIIMMIMVRPARRGHDGKLGVLWLDCFARLFAVPPTACGSIARTQAAALRRTVECPSISPELQIFLSVSLRIWTAYLRCYNISTKYL